MDRVAVVTGANRGIGREVTRQLAERGFHTILTARDETKGRTAAQEIGVDFLQLDVSDDISVERCARNVESEFGRVDVLVNNAAIHYDTWHRGVDADLTTVHEAFETNVLGAWRTSQGFIPLMGRNKWGRIVNVSSQAGSLASMGAGTPAYSVSKAALNAFTRVLAAELKNGGILVNSVCPGWVATDMGGAGGRPVEAGAASIMWAVLLDADGPTGGFFRDGRSLSW